MRLPFLTTVLVGALSLSAMAGALPKRVRVPVDVVKGNNAFADDLLRELRRKNWSGNLLFSPLSISTAFGMLYGGAKGQTAEEIRQALHFPEDAKRTHAAYRQLAASLNIRTKACQLRTANALFSQKGYGILPDYLAFLKTNYQAGAWELDFVGDPAGSAGAMGRWIERQTAGFIKGMIDPRLLTADTRCVLVNAVYFNSYWADRFRVEDTRRERFQPLTGAPYSVHMMRQTEDFLYLENDFVQVVELPYVGRRYAMDILLPKATVSLAEVEKRFVDSTIAVNLDNLVPRLVALSLPRFEIDGPPIGLIPHLQRLGMTRAFSSQQAELGKVSMEPGLFVQFVLHKARIRVDEKGTEAAAATGWAGAGGIEPEPPKPIVFRADHPFLFVLRDRRTGAILFLGRLAQPSRAAPRP